MNNKGISVISLVITIIIIILITSITLYNGIPMITNSNQKLAEDRIKAIANAIVAYEKELNYMDNVGDASNPRLISVADYDIMGLSDYGDYTKVPPTYVYKESNGSIKTYHLKTYKTVKVNYLDDDEVTYSFDYQEEPIKHTFKVEFDEAKGVNRPLISNDMDPVILKFVNNFYDVHTVNDIYSEDWYNYDPSAPMWANVMIKSSGDDLHGRYVYYVWIPRFAYKLSYFDANSDYNNIPSSSIQIEFLRGTTDYMKNNEVLPSGFQVHPAFKYLEDGREVNIAGFWVAKEIVGAGAEALFNNGGSGKGAVEKSELLEIHPNAKIDADTGDYEMESHLLKNTEWAAVAYLSHATVGNVADGSSLGEWNASGVFNLNSLQYVAAGLVANSSANLPAKLSFGDKYYYYVPNASAGESGEVLIYSSYEKETLRYGDAMIATSSGLSANSAWFGGTSVKPTTAAPYIMRGYDNNLFAYSAITREPFGGGAFKNVILVHSK